MKLVDFARERNVNRDTITQYIRRNEEQFSGHTRVDGKCMYIDEEALKILDKQYPLMKPIEVVEDIETIKKLSDTRLELAKAERKVAELQEKLLESANLVAQAEATKVLLEDKEAQIKEYKEQRDRADEMAAKRESENKELTQELSKYKRTIFGLYKKE